MFEYIKSIIFGIVEGITEWLPVSSTGHLILLNEFLKLAVTEAFYDMYQVVIQLGAILAVIVLFFRKLNPFALSKSREEKKQTWELWFKVCLAILPSGVLGVLFDDWMDANLHNGIVVYSNIWGKLAQFSFILALVLSFWHFDFEAISFPIDRWILWIAVGIAIIALVDYTRAALKTLREVKAARAQQ